MPRYEITQVLQSPFLLREDDKNRPIFVFNVLFKRDNTGAIKDDLRTRLATAVSGTVGTDVFSNRIPENPDAISVVIESGGMPPQKFLGSTAEFENPTIQFLFRGAPFDMDEVSDRAHTAMRDIIQIEAETLTP